MSAIITGQISFRGQLGSVFFQPAGDGKKAYLSVSIYNGRSYVDKQGIKHQSQELESVEVNFWADAAVYLKGLIDNKVFEKGRAVSGTGYIADKPKVWLKNGIGPAQPDGKVAIDGSSLCPDPLRDHYLQQGKAQAQNQGAQGATRPDQQSGVQGLQDEVPGWAPAE